MFNGISQIETWEQERIDSQVRRGLVRDVEFPYDIDPWTNIINTWGYPWTWFWPWGSAPSSGEHFDKNEAATDGPWPPDHIDRDRPISNSLPRQYGEIEPSRSPQSSRSVSDSSNGSGSSPHQPLTYAQSVHQQSLRQRADRNGITSSNIPSWRHNITSDRDFFNRDQWQNFEGEKISDFGVDVESELSPVEQRPLQGRTALSPLNHGHSADTVINDDDSYDDDEIPLAQLLNAA